MDDEDEDGDGDETALACGFGDFVASGRWPAGLHQKSQNLRPWRSMENG